MSWEDCKKRNDQAEITALREKLRRAKTELKDVVELLATERDSWGKRETELMREKTQFCVNCETLAAENRLYMEALSAIDHALTDATMDGTHIKWAKKIARTALSEIEGGNNELPR